MNCPAFPFCRLPARQGCPCKAGRVPIDETNYSPPAPIEQPAQAPSSNARDVQMPNSVRKAKATVKTAKGTESAPPKGVVAYQGEPGGTASGLHRGLSRSRASGLSDVRGHPCRSPLRWGALCNDPDPEFGRRPASPISIICCPKPIFISFASISCAYATS